MRARVYANNSSAIGFSAIFSLTRANSRPVSPPPRSPNRQRISIFKGGGPLLPPFRRQLFPALVMSVPVAAVTQADQINSSKFIVLRQREVWSLSNWIDVMDIQATPDLSRALPFAVIAPPPLMLSHIAPKLFPFR